ncbi:MAG: neutral zinc metallopeptidase [Ilumatobacteraceae bacterium]
MRKRAAVSLLLVGAVLAACGTVDGGVTATRSRRNDAIPVVTGSTTPSTDTPSTDTPSTDTPSTDTPSTDPGGTTNPNDPNATVPDDTTFDTRPPEAAIPVPADQKIIDFGSTKTPQAYDGFLIAAFQDIEKFWAEQMPATFGKPFEPLAGGIFAAYKSRTESIPGCGNARTTFRDVEGNAFYCSQGDFIVYDDDELLPQLVSSLGQSAVGVVLAHEFGHAIQQRNGDFDQPTILKEQQADCFAGAWSAHVSRGEADGLSFGDAEIKNGLIAMIQVADPVNGDVRDPNAHGTGFDRVGAFQDGFLGGTERCKTFFTEDRQKSLIDISFDPRGNGGNLPFIDPAPDPETGPSDIVTLMPKDLDLFWVQKLAGVEGANFTPPTLDVYQKLSPPACNGQSGDFAAQRIFFCTATNQIMVEQQFAESLATPPDGIGDLADGYLIGEAYSEAVQQTLGSSLTAKKRVLLNDCFTGAWVAADIPSDPTNPRSAPVGGGGLTLSAGDLDEAIITALFRSDDSSDENKRGTAFEKISSFRGGVLGGIDACRAQLG